MSVPVQHPMYIDGQFVTWRGDAWIDVVNPATEAVISRIPDGQAEDARKAIDAAERAQPEWEALPAIERASWLRKISAGIRERASEISALIVEEGGKIQQLAEVEVAFTADYIDYMAEWARRYEGEIIQSDRPGENILLFKRALGVTTGILPWNFPFFLIARKMAPALLTGNTIVIKPSEFTPNNAIAFAKIVDEIGLPRGVFNLVLGRGETVGQELAGNPKVAMVSMTGSVSAGEKIMATAAKNITKVCLELGGKAPAIVMDDADLELAVKAIVDSRVINSGQVCNCAERVYVQKGIYDQFVNRLGEAMQAVQFGNPAERNDIAMGPLINAAALERVEQKVARAVEEGARVALGGKAVEGKGYYYPPTLLLDVRQEMSIMHEETFGPVLPVVAFDTLEEAISMANDSDYGLTSSIYTQNLNVAMKAIKGLKFGETYINRENFEAMQGFHAGWRKSGIGGACFSYTSNTWPVGVEIAGARLLMNQDGTINVQSGATEIGQGADTVFSQMVAETVGVPVSDVRVISTQDTDVTPFDPGAFASRQSYVAAPALRSAALLLKEKIIAHAAVMLHQSAMNLTLIKGHIVLVERPEEPLMSLKDLAMDAFYHPERGGQLSAESSIKTTTNPPAFGCTFVDLTVDIALCKVTINRILNVHDSGHILNPLLAEGQVHGGMGMGIGWALFEEMIIDAKSGVVRNPNLLDYKMPTMPDLPQLESAFVEINEPQSAYGHKSLGEPPIIPVAAAIRNAVKMATGVAINTLPLTPKRLYEEFHLAGLI